MPPGKFLCTIHSSRAEVYPQICRAMGGGVRQGGREGGGDEEVSVESQS